MLLVELHQQYPYKQPTGMVTFLYPHQPKSYNHIQGKICQVAQSVSLTGFYCIRKMYLRHKRVKNQ